MGELGHYTVIENIYCNGAILLCKTTRDDS
jgi:hypothetical protein